MTPTNAVADLLKTDLVWRKFFRRCCELGTFRLRAQAWQFRAGLAERGEKTDPEEVREALLEVAAKALPGTPAGRGETPSGGAIRTERQALDAAREYVGREKGGAA